MKLLFTSLMMLSSLAAFATGFKTMTADELNAGVNKKENIQVYDANTDAVRKKFGVISGATKIKNSSGYEASVLPANKNTKVVFYCYNEMCTASHNAAKRAMELGYANAYVMKDGITGWADKKYPIER